MFVAEKLTFFLIPNSLHSAKVEDFLFLTGYQFEASEVRKKIPNAITIMARRLRIVENALKVIVLHFYLSKFNSTLLGGSFFSLAAKFVKLTICCVSE